MNNRIRIKDNPMTQRHELAGVTGTLLEWLDPGMELGLIKLDNRTEPHEGKEILDAVHFEFFEEPSAEENSGAQICTQIEHH